jgi:outer membrane biosynthesis protein TonB
MLSLELGLDSISILKANGIQIQPFNNFKMKTAMFLAASGAILAIATPLDLEKRKWETEVVIEWETVTVTEGAHPTFAAGGAHHHAPQLTTSTTSTTPTPEPTTVQPEPTTTPVAVVESVAPAAPEPTIEPVTEAAAPPAAETPEAAAPAAPPATTAQAQAAEPTDYASTAVYHHNLHRLNYSAPALEWGQTYADYAAETAAKCVFAHDM